MLNQLNIKCVTNRTVWFDDVVQMTNNDTGKPCISSPASYVFAEPLIFALYFLYWKSIHHDFSTSSKHSDVLTVK